MLVTRLLLTVRGERQSCPLPIPLPFGEVAPPSSAATDRVSTSNAISVLDTETRPS